MSQSTCPPQRRRFPLQAVLQKSTRLMLDADASPRRQIAIPYHSPSFDEIAELGVDAALVGQRVAALCLREALFRRWQRYLNERALIVPRLDLLDVYAASVSDWLAFLAQHDYDIAIFHGIRVALESRDLALDDAERLVNATSAGLIVLA